MARWMRLPWTFPLPRMSMIGWRACSGSLSSEHEAAQLDLPVGAAVYRIRRIARTATRPVEINLITAAGERYELYYEFPAE